MQRLLVLKLATESVELVLQLVDVLVLLVRLLLKLKDLAAELWMTGASSARCFPSNARVDEHHAPFPGRE